MPLQLVVSARWEAGRIRMPPKPYFVTASQAVATLAWVLTTFFVCWQLVRERIEQCKQPAGEGRIAASIRVRGVRQVIFTPFVLCTVSWLSLFFPAQAFGLDMTVSIGAVLAISATVFHFLDVLGEPPSTELIVSKLPRKRWWCGSQCGGFADVMPYLAYCFGQSKEEQPMTIRQLRIAYYMVAAWCLVSIIVATVNLVFYSWPKRIEQTAKGWCITTPQMDMTLNTLLTIVNVWSSLFGLSGFGVLSGAASLSLAHNAAVLSQKIRKKSELAKIYVSLPMLKVFFTLLPVHFRTPTTVYLSPSSVSTSRSANSSNWVTVRTETLAERLQCPLYDTEVMTLLMYATSLTLCMSVLAYSNWKQYPYAEWDKVPSNPLDTGSGETESEEVEVSDMSLGTTESEA